MKASNVYMLCYCISSDKRITLMIRKHKESSNDKENSDNSDACFVRAY